VGLAILMDFLLPLKDKQISLAHPKAHFRRVFEITGMAQDFRILEAA
jgi:anti-anti-sigma regulatory factor